MTCVHYKNVFVNFFPSTIQNSVVSPVDSFFSFPEILYWNLPGILYSIYGTKIHTCSNMLHINLLNLRQIKNLPDVGVGVGIQPNYGTTDELQVKKYYYLVTMAASPKMT